MCSPLEKMAKRLPQMYFKPENGISDSAEYKNVVLKLKDISSDRKLSDVFIGSSNDRLFKVQSPAGEAEVLYLDNRKDFENFYRVTVGMGENIDVPLNMGACTIIGLNDVDKIKTHVENYIKNGGQYPESEKMDFISKPQNYKFTLIVLSKGNYSNITYKLTKYAEDEWQDISYKIRLYHELCHFMVRKIHIEKNAVWDEILADCMGLLFATGEYDENLASRFLGVSHEKFILGGRLINYSEEEDIDLKAKQAYEAILSLKKYINENRNLHKDIYGLILAAQENRKLIAEKFFD